MDQRRRFRFGILSFGTPTRDEWVSQARRTEELGYATISMADHLFSALAPIAAMQAAVEATTSIRVGSCVFGNDFRHPVVLAKEVASLDMLSGGRLEFGFGTGYWRGDYEQPGIPFDPPGVRVARFAEAVQLVKAAFGDEEVPFSGMYYQVRGLDLQPKPVQRPHPPLLIGGGSRRLLALAAREADIVGINVRTTAEGGFDWDSIAPGATEGKVAWVREAAGERFDGLELHALAPFVAVTDEPRRAAAAILKEWGVTDQMAIDDLLASPHTLIGTEDEIVTGLRERRLRYGISYVTVFAPALELFAPIVRRLTGH
jgi:probable F420-dependent oxidoreductase